jgi:hypothetical protein
MYFRYKRCEDLEVPSISELYKIQSFDAAREKRSHAVDVSIDELEDALTSAPSSRLRAVFAFLTFTGLRGVDFNYLCQQGTESVSICRQHIKVDVAVGKNRRDPESRVTLHLSPAMQCLWRPRLLKILMLDKGLLAFHAADLHGLATFFEMHGLSSRVQGKKLTTYSLRRCFCHRAIEQCKREDGSTDWERAIGFTLHKSASSLRSAYAMKASDEVVISSDTSNTSSSASQTSE